MFPFIVSLLVVVFGALLQTTNVFLIGAVNPNIVFPLFAIIAHIHKDWAKRSIIVLVTALILKFSPTAQWFDLVFITTSLLVIALTDYFPWKRMINSIFATAVGTIIIGFKSFEVGTLLPEILINVVLVIVFFFALEPIYVKENKKPKSRF